MKKTFLLVSLAWAASLSCMYLSLSAEPMPWFQNTQSGRPVKQALDNRSPIRSFSADLEVTKFCKPDEPITVGQQATCTIIVRNLGPDPAHTVVIIDRLSSTGAFIIGDVTADEGSCTTTFTPRKQGGTVTCTAASIASNAAITITVPLSANVPQDINDIVTVSGQPFDPIPGNNSASGAVHVIAPGH